jgi:phosphodiesterase/alkaline phosphatase D-like protein
MAVTKGPWSGGLLPGGFTVKCKAAPGASCRLVVSTVDSTLASPVYSSSATADANGWVGLTITGLAADTQHYYGIEEAGVVDAVRGMAKTLPTAGVASSFTFAHASCALTGSAHPVFTRIKERAPLFFAHLGDAHYGDIYLNDQSLYRAAIESAIGSATQAPLYADVPIEYMWDDHDYGASNYSNDNGDRTSVGRPAARAVYRQTVPTHTLPDADAVYRSWQVGRVWFINTDLRYYRDPDPTTDSAAKTMMGTAQKTWFKAQLSAAKAAGAPLIFWISTVPWRVDPPFTGVDVDLEHWGGFSYERREIADYCLANNIRNVVILSGDTHMLAYDRLARDYTTAGGLVIPSFQAAPLDQIGHTRDHDWESGMFPGNGSYGQYAVVEVIDNGGAVATMTWTGLRVTAAGVESTILQTTYTPGSSTTVNAKVWDGAAWVPRTVKVWNGSSWAARPVKVPA